MNIPAPKLEEGELAGNRRSAPHKGQSPREDVAWDQRGSHERRSRDIYSRNRDSSERASREHHPHPTSPPLARAQPIAQQGL